MWYWLANTPTCDTTFYVQELINGILPYACNLKLIYAENHCFFTTILNTVLCIYYYGTIPGLYNAWLWKYEMKWCWFAYSKGIMFWHVAMAVVTVTTVSFVILWWHGATTLFKSSLSIHIMTKASRVLTFLQKYVQYKSNLFKIQWY